jgi:hypothetical protein
MKVPVLPPRIPIYRNNGLGRDTYISGYNGGFGNYKYSRSYKKDTYNIPIHRYHPNLFKRRPIDKYQMSGEGRDYFIYKGIQTEHERISGNNSFEKTLRSDDSPSVLLRSTQMPRNKFEKKLINRIFYGKCPGVKDRQMSPKVKFKKDVEKEREKQSEEIKISVNDYLRTEESETNRNNKTKKKINLRSSFLNGSKPTETGNMFNTTAQLNNYNIMMTPVNSHRKKKLFMNGNNNLNNNNQECQDLLNSVKKIFMYNSNVSRNKVGNEFY